jgi:acyl-CoA thioester hydrolase
MKLFDFKHIKRVVVRYDDLDTFSHVNNKAYLSYLEEARVDYHKQLFEWKGLLEFNAIVARIEINYILPVFYGDDLSLYTRASNIGNKSFELETYFVVQKGEEKVKVAEAKVVLVAIDPKTGKTRPIPEEEKRILLEFEGKA